MVSWMVYIEGKESEEMTYCTILVNGENHTGQIDGDRVYVRMYGELCWYKLSALIKMGDGFYRYYSHD